MGATNTTTHYNLSQFVSTDKPAWLQDYNGDMAKIDAAKVTADTAQTTANAASGAATQNTNDIAALSTDVTGQGANITALQLAVNTINSLIGNGTPTTTDQTIIGAINELHADILNGGLKTVETVVANAYTSFSSALQHIHTAFSGLTTAEKATAILKIGDIIMNINDINGEHFGSSYAGTASWQIYGANLISGAYVYCNNGNLNNYSSNPQNVDITLYKIK